jgi:hypothetical protein
MENKKTKPKVKNKKQTTVESLSSFDKNDDFVNSSLLETQDKIFNEINNLELQKSLLDWEKKFKQKQKIGKRDLSILKENICEYMNTFLLFGYNLDDDRVIIQKFENPRDRDAIMEFMKNIFIRQQNENFLD